MLRGARFLLRAQRSQPGLDNFSACLPRPLLRDAGAACSTSGNIRSCAEPCCVPVHGYAKLAEEDEGSGDEPAIPAHPRVQKLAEEIMHLNLLEISDLTEILQKRLNIQAPAFGGGMPMMGGHMAGAAAQAAPAQAAPAEKEPEKTEFDVKLDGFDAASKIKVIKEVRVITELGLKEAKELVEKAPIVVKPGLKKEEAEELKRKLEAVGGKVSLD